VCIVREPILERYLGLVRKMENYFKGFIVEYIKRNKNCGANELDKATARNSPGSSISSKAKIGELR
jgi:hypothetical protein